MSRDGSVGIATDYGLNDRMIGVRFPAGAGNFPLHHRVQTGCGVLPASYPIGNGSCFPGVKWPERESDHSIPSRVGVEECVELYLHSSNTSSGRGVLSTGTTLPFTFN
jgi:hypothetical protein